jgi:hypothetical protein
MWFNKSTNELSSTPPWGNAWISDDIQSELYSDWSQVSDNYVPTIALTTQQKINALNAEYLPQFAAIKDAIASASAIANTDQVAALQTAYQTLWAEYNTKMEAITSVG